NAIATPIAAIPAKIPIANILKIMMSVYLMIFKMVIPIHRNNETFTNKKKIRPTKIINNTAMIKKNESKIISGRFSLISVRICRHLYTNEIEIIITKRKQYMYIFCKN